MRHQIPYTKINLRTVNNESHDSQKYFVREKV